MAAEPNRLSVQEYLRLERQAETKSEYLDGQMVAMTGGTLRHNGIIANVVSGLHRQFLNGPCRVFPNNLRVRIPSANVYVYPDVTVVCGEPRIEDAYADTLLNPTVVIEVLSPSTEAYDRGKKRRWYQSLDSLSEYVLVSQNAPLIERYIRHDGDGWLLTCVEDLDSIITLPSVQAELVLADIYHKVAIG